MRVGLDGIWRFHAPRSLYQYDVKFYISPAYYDCANADKGGGSQKVGIFRGHHVWKLPYGSWPGHGIGLHTLGLFSRLWHALT